MKKYEELINKETLRQNNTLSLIASENYVSSDVLRALGSCLTNKYAEGYSGKRYYAGNEVIDEIEDWAKDLGLKVFGLSKDEWHINVQPYSGSPANLAIYAALLEPGDKILAMKLEHGGHLTHGHKVSLTGKFYNFEHYGVNEEGWLDYDEIRKLALSTKPKLIVAGATAYSRELDFAEFKKIADELGAYLLADISHIAGLIAAGEHPSCWPWADVVMTTTHKTLRGPRGAIIVCRKELGPKIDKAVFPGLQGGPHENVILAKGVCFEEALTEEFKLYQRQVKKNAQFLAKSLIDKGVKILTNGTDNHLILLNLSKLKQGASLIEKELEKVNIVVNKNTIPNDKRSPLDPSGIRMGVPAVTTRGLTENEMGLIADMVFGVIEKAMGKEIDTKKYLQIVKKITDKYPLNY